MHYLPIREPFTIPSGTGDFEVTTARLIDICLSYFPPQQAGLSGTDIIWIEDVRLKVRDAKDNFIELSDQEYNHLKGKNDACKYPFFGPGVARFIKDVRDARTKPELPEGNAEKEGS